MARQNRAQFVAFKAAYMVGVLGTGAIKPRVLEALPKVRHAVFRGLFVSVLDFFSPKGDAESARKLRAIVDDVERSKDAALMGSQSHFRHTVYRLEARAE